MFTHKVITMSSSMPKFDMIDYALMAVIAVLAVCCYMCYTKESYAPLAYFTVAEPKYQVESQNVMSAPIVYNIDEAAGQSVRPFAAGPVSPVMEEYSRESFMQPPSQDIKTIVPAHLSGGFVNPLSNPQMGFLPGGMEYGVSVPAMGNLSSSVTSDNSPGALNVWSTVI